MALTKKDIELLKETFVTKDEFTELRGEVAELRSEVKELKNDIIQFKDDILYELKGLRDEITIVVGYRDRIEEHEDRRGYIDRHLRITTKPQ